METKQNKTDIDLCVCLNGSSDFNKPYFYMETVRLETEEYTLEDKLWF